MSVERSPDFWQPVDGTKMPKFAGIATFMKLPHVPLDQADDVEIGLIGVPWDGGTTLRPGARHGPRQVREHSTFMRNLHHVLRINPYDLCRCADLGDVNINPVNLQESMKWVEAFYAAATQKRVVPLSVGGDHLVSLPILRAVAKAGPVGMIHFDAHTDMHDDFAGEATFSHGTPFFHAVNEGLLDPRRVVQVGIRGCMYTAEDRSWGLDRGVTIIDIDDFARLGVSRTADKILQVVGSGPTYLSVDIDSIDPAYAPGTGTPEVGGLTSREILALLRSLEAVDLIGADLVEISPPFDQAGGTALLGATLLFEELCLLARSQQRRRERAREGSLR